MKIKLPKNNFLKVVWIAYIAFLIFDAFLVFETPDKCKLPDNYIDKACVAADRESFITGMFVILGLLLIPIAILHKILNKGQKIRTFFEVKKAINFLTKYKSHIVLAVLVGVGSFLLGHTVAYNNDITWVYYNGSNTKELISNFRKTYDKQREIALNYQTAYQALLDCMLHKPDCDTETSSQKQLELSNTRNILVDELNKLNFETDRIMTKFSLSNPSLQNQPSPSASNAVTNQENTTSSLNVPDSWKDTSNNIEDYYKVYKNPTVLYLRKALNAYLANDSSDINISNIAVIKNTGDGIISGLESFDKEYYRSKFVVLTINKSISGGVDIQILFQDKPDRIFYAWVYQLADGSFELRAFNSKEEIEPKAMKALQVENKIFLEDKEHAL